MDLKDLTHRAGWTAVEVFAGFVTVDALTDASLGYWKVAAASAVAAVAVVVKETARARLSRG